MSEQSMVHRLLASMDAWGASDLFLAEGRRPAARIAGSVAPLDLPSTTRAELDQLLGEVLSGEQRRRFDETGDVDAGHSLQDGRRFRFNVGRQRGQTCVTARAVPSGAVKIADLGLPEAVATLAGEQRGLVLVTGATGSGKSTTLAAMVHAINVSRAAHVVTIEDPIEFVHTDVRGRVTQREVGGDTRSFGEALRHVLRQSPDVIMLGELRDAESVSTAVAAAMTGHLVLASIHTVDVTQTMQRLLNLVPEEQRPQLALDLSLALRGIVCQRLLPRADGKGRVLACELLTLSPSYARLIREQRVEELADLMRGPGDHGVMTFTRSVLGLLERKLVTHDVARAAASNPDEFNLAAKGMSAGVVNFSSGASARDALQGLDMKALLSFALSQRASDLHLAVGRSPILRIKGQLFPLEVPPLTAADLRTLLFSLLSGRQRTVYELEREIDFALQLDNGQRFRVNAYFQRGNMAAALRLIPDTPPDARQLGIPADILSLVDRSQGLLLVVGPTGAGKTTTLASFVQRINHQRSCRIITIEDPIEYSFKGHLSTIDQRELNADTLSFSRALKYVLRQDPDVILVGEMRDLETIGSALTAAETGHLVLATLHTNDAVQAIDRMIDVFPAHQQAQVRAQLASCLLAIVSQRLLPRKDGTGRVAAFEVLVANSGLRAVIREDKLHQAHSLMETGRVDGNTTMDRALQELVVTGQVTMDEALRHARSPRHFQEATEVALAQGASARPPGRANSSPSMPAVGGANVRRPG